MTADKRWSSSFGVERVKHVIKCYIRPPAWTESFERPKQLKMAMSQDSRQGVVLCTQNPISTRLRDQQILKKDLPAYRFVIYVCEVYDINCTAYSMEQSP